MRSATEIHSFRSQLKYGVVVTLAALMVLAPLSAPRADECELAKQLDDPLVRADYETIVRAYRTVPDATDVEGMYDRIVPARYGDEREIPRSRRDANILDPISMECITCHDGIGAKSANSRISALSERGAHGLQTIVGSHPVGMSYVKFANNREYAHWQTLPKQMVLMDGNVGCATCHDLTSKNRLYLTVDNAGSGLCFSCHIK